MNKLLDSISSGLQSKFDSTIADINTGEDYQRHKVPLEMYAFLLQWFVLAAEKVKPTDGEANSAAAPRARRGRGGRGGRTGGRSAASRKEAEQWTWNDQIPGTLALISKGLLYL
ncbi:hypothetical protein K435DRAFT_885278, partial [Dendrothele bispora CBS 962.96]